MLKMLMTGFCMISMIGISFAQTNQVKGTVKDENNGSSMAGATVMLLKQADSSMVETKVTDATGSFLFDNLANDRYILTINTMDYQQAVRFFDMQNNAIDFGTMEMMRMGKDLEGVIIVARAPAAVQKGDTSQFSASQFKVNPDASTEDLIKKMPGITVAKDGTVTAQGEQVRKVTVDGKEFFGDDASAALRNLPSEIVDKIQVFDKLSDQAQMSGVDDGNSEKTLNIVTKSGVKNGQFGRIYAGMGTDERYSAGGNVSFFNGDRRLSFVANINNINQQNFGSQDLLGIGGGSGRGGGRGNNNFSVGQSAGISKTNAFGVNYSDKYGEKVELTGSYFFNQSKNHNQSTENTQITKNNQFSKSISDATTENLNHRLNLRMEYKIDSNNTIIISPRLNIQNNHSVSNSLQNTYKNISDSLINSKSNRNNDRAGLSFRNDINYRHSFAKKGRSLSLRFTTDFSNNSGENYTYANYRFYDSLGIFTDSLQDQFSDNNSNSNRIGARIAYTEPLGKNSVLQWDYSPEVQKSHSDQETYLFDVGKYEKLDTSLTNKFDNTVTTHNTGLSYRWSKGRDAMLSFGVDYETSQLESERIFPTNTSVDQRFSNFLPHAMYRQKLSAFSNIRLFYRSRNNFPSVTQLQDVINLNNPLRISMGNPTLKQSYSHFLAGRYTFTNTRTNRSLFANIFLQSAQDYISNALYIAENDSTIQNGIVLKSGSQLSRPVNLDGYKSLRTYLTYSMPLKFMKTTLNLNAGFNYSRLPGLINYSPVVTNNYVYNGGLVLASNISEYVDFNISYDASLNNVINNYDAKDENKYVNQSLGFRLNLLNKKGWFVQNDVNNETYSGLSEGLNQSFWLWNAGIGKKFLKNNAGELKLSVFDLLKQNQSITREVDNTGITDRTSVVLQQYFMLTFTYNLKNFGTGKTPEREGQHGPGMRF